MPKVTPEYLEARRNEILDAAFACFRRKGFHQTTMQDIYREAGLSAGAVYHYFHSKEEMISAAIDRNTAEWAAIIAEVRSAEPGLNQALETIGHHFFNRFLAPDFEREARLDVECWPEMLRDGQMLDAVRRQIATLRASFVDLFKQAQAEGHLVNADQVPPEHIGHIVNLLFAVYMGLQLNYLVEPDAVDPQGVLHVLLMLASPWVSGAGPARSA